MAEKGLNTSLCGLHMFVLFTFTLNSFNQGFVINVNLASIMFSPCEVCFNQVFL